MSCPYTQCSDNSSAGNCIADRDPNTCTFGIHQKEIKAAHEKGIRRGLEIAKELIEEAMRKQG